MITKEAEMSKGRIFHLMALLLAAALAFYGCDTGGTSGGGGGGGGKKTITARGGDATDAAGSGGYMYTESSYENGVQFRRSGSVSTSFSILSYINNGVAIGSNGKTITTDTIINSVAGGDSEPAVGTLYTVVGDTTVYESNGNGTKAEPSEEVTGISIAKGVTVTFGLNVDSGGNTGTDTARIWLTDGIEINGTVTTNPLSIIANGTIDNRHSATATGRDRGALDLQSDGNIIIASTGKIDLKGGNATTADTRGGDGGSLYVWSANLTQNRGTIDVSGGDGDGTGIGGDAGVQSGGTPLLELDAWDLGVQYPDYQGSVVNRGIILANGGDGSSGGQASEVYLYAYSHVFNTAKITANGGTGNNGDGGSSDWGMTMESVFGSVFNSGDIEQKGGESLAGGDGGGGGSVYFYSASDGYSGDVVNSGDLNTSGGDCSDTSCQAGPGGQIFTYSYGAIRTSGNLAMNGGVCAADGCSGGDGGYLEYNQYKPFNYSTLNGDWNYLPTREFKVTGNISLDGGSATGTGADGGSAGELRFYQNADNGESTVLKHDTGIEFVGYSKFDLSGGNSTDGDGGNAHDVGIEVYAYDDVNSDGQYFAAGPIVIEPDVDLSGGSGLTAGGSGAHDGEVLTWSDHDAANATLTLKGDWNFSGGDCSGAPCTAGDSGGIYAFQGFNGVTTSGKLTNRGGDCNTALCTGGTGNYYNFHILAGSGDVVNTGRINTRGGNGHYAGDGSDGTECNVALYSGTHVRNGGQILSPGGNSSDAAGTNGSGGYVDMFSGASRTSNTASISVRAGSGGDGSGQNGRIWIDWVDITPADGVL
jgi:hypothetical protein